MKNMLLSLMNDFCNLQNVITELEGFDIEMLDIPGGMGFKLTRKPVEKKDEPKMPALKASFIEYIKSLDDNVFEMASDAYPESGVGTLKQLSDVLDETSDKNYQVALNGVNTFKACVRKAAQDIVNSYVEKYEL